MTVEPSGEENQESLTNCVFLLKEPKSQERQEKRFHLRHVVFSEPHAATKNRKLIAHINMNSLYALHFYPHAWVCTLAMVPLYISISLRWFPICNLNPPVSCLQELTWKDEVERLIHEWTEDKEDISTKELLGLLEFYETHRDDFPSFWKPPPRNFKRLRQAESRCTNF